MKKTATKIVIDSYRKANNKPLTDEEILKGYTGTRKDHDMACLCKTVICRGKALECMAKARAEGKKEGIAESEKERPKHFNIDYKERFEKVLKELKDCHRTNKAFYENGVADGQKKRCGK